MEKLSMLIVDDEANNRQILSTMIRQTGQEFLAIFQAKDIPEAIEVINRKLPEMVFLDINLQNESGFNLLQQLPDRRLR